MSAAPNSDRKPSGVRPGAILRAMGAAPGAISPAALDLPDIDRSAAPTAHSPFVEVVRDGDRVQKILAHCRCGEVIAIDCDYADSPQAATT